jgi:hypothetical protein
MLAVAHLPLLLLGAVRGQRPVPYSAIFKSCLVYDVECLYTTAPDQLVMPVDASFRVSRNLDDLLGKYNLAAGKDVSYLSSSHYNNTLKLVQFCAYDNLKCVCQP